MNVILCALALLPANLSSASECYLQIGETARLQTFVELSFDLSNLERLMDLDMN